MPTCNFAVKARDVASVVDHAHSLIIIFFELLLVIIYLVIIYLAVYEKIKCNTE